ncbi:MAG: hypothetical protein ACE5J7_03875 [Candidatus Aenigmatarchaeota archaeon]
MKGFAATPIIFIAVFLIIALLFLHFMDMDKRVAEGIGKEARIRKLQAQSIKQEISSESTLFYSSLFFAQYSKDRGELENYLSDLSNRTVTVSQKPNSIMVSHPDNHSLSLIDAQLNRSLSASATVPYPFFELTNAVGSFDVGQIDNKDCNTIDTTISDYLDSFSPVIWYPNMTWQDCYLSGSQWRCPFNLTLLYNWVENNYFSERYPHYVGESYTGECYFP